MEGNMQGNNQSVAIASTSNPRQHTIRCYGVKGTEVDQSCFNDPVKWINVQVSEPCPHKGVHKGNSRLWGILQILTRRSGNGKSLPLRQTNNFL